MLAPLLRQYQRKLDRELTESERGILVERLTSLGGDRLGDLVLDLDGPALERWLRAPVTD